MELWIRSQNKKQLAEITGIILEDNEIRGFTNQKDYYELGKYKTAERALEVLDEIHQRLIDLQTIEIEPGFARITKRCVDIVYEMPEE